MKLTLINTTLEKIHQASDLARSLADSLHTAALNTYPDQAFMLLDSQSLAARNLHLQLQNAYEIRRFESGVFAKSLELQRLTVRLQELESYYYAASEDDSVDLLETIENINADRLEYKKSIHSALNAEFQLTLSQECIATLADLNISL
jgi:hypothetical protein